MRIYLSGQDDPWEIPQDLVEKLNEAYYDVAEHVKRLELWTLVNPQRRPKAGKGAKRFLVNCLNSRAKLKPMIESSVSVSFTTGWETKRTPESIEQGRQAVDRLKQMVRR